MGLFSSSSTPTLPPPKIAKDGAPIAPDRSQRAKCWEARDMYFECLNKESIVDSIAHKDKAEKACSSEGRAFESNCASSWVCQNLSKRLLAVLRGDPSRGGDWICGAFFADRIIGHIFQEAKSNGISKGTDTCETKGRRSTADAWRDGARTKAVRQYGTNMYKYCIWDGVWNSNYLDMIILSPLILSKKQITPRMPNKMLKRYRNRNMEIIMRSNRAWHQPISTTCPR